jgi:hypothetical protein
MIGERLESHDSPPWGALLLLVAGLGLAAAGWISGNNGIVPGAVLPMVVGGSLWIFGRERPFTATFREEGLEVENAGEPVLIPYASIQNIHVGGRAANRRDSAMLRPRSRCFTRVVSYVSPRA